MCDDSYNGTPKRDDSYTWDTVFVMIVTHGKHLSVTIVTRGTLCVTIVTSGTHSCDYGYMFDRLFKS